MGSFSRGANSTKQADILGENGAAGGEFRAKLLDPPHAKLSGCNYPGSRGIASKSMPPAMSVLH
jgi:hypothetical protein